MSNIYKEWAKEQRDKTKRLTTAPNKALVEKWTKEQRDKAEKLLKSWSHQKKSN